MHTNLILPLINNAALLLSLSIIYEISNIFRLRLKKYIPFFNGFLIGLIGIAIMTVPFILEPGLFFDTRSILISVTALVFGIIPASIAAGMTLIYRIILGGIGAIPGCAMIVVSLIIGLLFRRYIKTKRTPWRWLKLYVFGIVVHIGMLLSLLFLPWETALVTLHEVSLPVLLIYPSGAVLLALLLLRQVEYNETQVWVIEAESRYKSLFYNNHAAMLIVDPEGGGIVDANPAAVAFYGWPENALKSMKMSEINTLPAAEVQDRISKTKQNILHYHQFKHRLASGQIADVEVYSGPIDIDGRTLLYSIIHDISSREAALSALRESEERFRALVDNAPDMILLLSSAKITYINKAGLRLLGANNKDELIGQPGLSIVHPDYRDAAHKQRSLLHAGTMQPTSTERIYVKLDGSLVYVDVTVVPLWNNDKMDDIVFAHDITERKLFKQKEAELEAQLRQQQKLEAIGTLAGGVAHEINNPLNGIMNYAQLIADDSDPESSNAEFAREIIHETERISIIVKNLLQFSRHEKQSHSYASIYDIIGQTISLVNTVIKKDQIHLDLQLDEGLPDIKCRSQQIQQVIMNLLTNARDSLNEKYPGYDEHKIIRVRCSVYERDGRKWMRLSVLDYGNGISDDQRDRIFEPFFSTKPKEIGTGLGLSISYGIVSEHHGTITFKSELGQYTNFILDLPVDNGWTL